MDEPKGKKKRGFPKQVKSYDLSARPDTLRLAGRKLVPTLDNAIPDHRTPEKIMLQLGFEPTKNMNPLQFLIAVMNDDLDSIIQNEARRKRFAQKGGFAINYRIECAKTAAKYIHMELPKVSVNKTEENKFSDSLAAAITESRARITTRRMVLEEVQKDYEVDLEPASYPPDFLPAEQADYEPDDGSE